MKTLPYLFLIFILTGGINTTLYGQNIPAKIKESNMRAGINNFLKKANSGKDLKVAYIGGSITYLPIRYTQQTSAVLRNLFPKNKITFINAGIPGTDADLGVCRVKEQVLDHKPDLIFIEFAVNGGFAEGVEGMIRKIWKQNPEIDIYLIYTLRTRQFKDYTNGKIPKVIQGLEKIADHYNIPSTHLGVHVSKLAAEGKLIPKGNPEEENEVPVFSKDGTHPLKAGGELYAAAIGRSFQALIKTKKRPKAHLLSAPLHADNWEDAKMFAPEKAAVFSGNWKRVVPEETDKLKKFQLWFPYLMKGDSPDDSFNVRFRGSMIGFFDIGGPEVGQLELSVDGQEKVLIHISGDRWKAVNKKEANTNIATNRFNRFCNNRYRGQYIVIDLPEGKHSVNFKISKRKSDKAKILGPNQQDDIGLNPDKYDQSFIYIGKILLRGDLISN